MEIPGQTPQADAATLAKADEQAASLLEELKQSVQAEVKDIGTLRKEMRITVPAAVIANQIHHNFDELAHDAFVPGFRKGHVPRKLIEKRFAQDVRQSLKTTIIAQAYFAAVENHKLDALGDPSFRVESEGSAKLVGLDEALPLLTLPEEGDFSYTVEQEIKPSFELPELKGIAVKRPEVQVTDAQVDERIERLRKIRGRYEPLAEGGAGADTDDMLVADVTLTCNGAEVKREEGVRLGVRPTRLDGIQLNELATVLTGAKTGDIKTTSAPIPDDYERPDLRGQTAEFALTVREVRRLVPAELDQIQTTWGADSPEQLRQFVRDDLDADRDQTIRRAEREQVREYLLKSTAFELPEHLSARQTDRAVVRRILELRQQGVPDDEIERNIDALRTSAREQVARDLRLSFVLEKVAATLSVEVTDEEVNTEIARMAKMYNRRFDRVRDDLQGNGLLDQLAEHIRQDKCIERLLADAQIA
jgi:trigger factor